MGKKSKGMVTLWAQKRKWETGMRWEDEIKNKVWGSMGKGGVEQRSIEEDGEAYAQEWVAC